MLLEVRVLALVLETGGWKAWATPGELRGRGRGWLRARASAYAWLGAGRGWEWWEGRVGPAAA
jgi:hypothetical protein